MSNARLLVVDIGNTSTSAGVIDRGRMLSTRRIESTVSDAGPIQAMLHQLDGLSQVEGAVLASVVPNAVPLWEAAIRTVCDLPTLVVHHRLDFGIPIDYPKPETIGPDRLANACYAAHHYGTPVVVADFGTALTFDIVVPKRGYIGGIIAPGLPLMFSYLAEKTALLPLIEPRHLRKKIGSSTEEAMQLGGRIGYRGMLREILQHLDLVLGEGYAVCSTGGHSAWVMKGLPYRNHPDIHLTLKGLGRIYMLNTRR